MALGGGRSHRLHNSLTLADGLVFPSQVWSIKLMAAVIAQANKRQLLQNELVLLQIAILLFIVYIVPAVCVGIFI